MRSAALVLTCMLVVGGCGGRSDRSSDSAAATTTTTTAAEAGGDGSLPVTTAPRTIASVDADEQGAAPPTSSPGAQAASAGPTTSTRPTLPPGNFTVEVALSKRCVDPGSIQTVSITSRPNAIVTYVTEYSDGATHDNNGGGVADGKGRYRDDFVIGAAPPGQAIVTATVATRDMGAAYGEARFRVGDC